MFSCGTDPELHPIAPEIRAQIMRKLAAVGNYREYLKGDLVRSKKYLYVLRPVLAAQWSMLKSGAPPMRFEALVAAMVQDPLILGEIADLLRQKRAVGEADLIPRKPQLNKFIESSLTQLESYAPPQQQVDISVLDCLLHETLLEPGIANGMS